MILYRYRPIESALNELESSTMHFSSRYELNDPLEGSLNVYFCGDSPAWEGLFRNYVVSMEHVIELFLLRAGREYISKDAVLCDIQAYDKIPIGNVYKRLADQFAELDNVKEMYLVLGKNKTKITERELICVLSMFHLDALRLCMQSMRENGLVQCEEECTFLELLSNKMKEASPAKLSECMAKNDVVRKAILNAMGDILQDMIEESFLSTYFVNDDVTDEDEEQKRIRNWLAISTGFPEMYVMRLSDIIYPDSYWVCFTGRNDDSSMWGNYASNHKGVCFIYDSDMLSDLGMLKPVLYDCDPIERNFFESLGRFSPKQIKYWLTGTAGISECFNSIIEDTESWRENYWDALEAKNYRKLADWKHEEEFRITLVDLLKEYSKPEKRNIKYKKEALKGVIFGINTSEYDKTRIIHKIIRRQYSDVVFYQAEYDKSKSIVIREKHWKLDSTINRKSS